MKKLHSLAFYALVTPAITLGAGSALAEQSADQDVERQQQNTQRDQDTMPSNQNEQSTQRTGQSQSQAGADQQKQRDQSRMGSQGYISSAPANGMQASDLIGAEIMTTGDEEVGSVSDLIIDQNGQVVAVVVGVGGFLGMGEKDVAIGWDDLKASGTADEQELRVNLSREDLEAAPEFEQQD